MPNDATDDTGAGNAAPPFGLQDDWLSGPTVQRRETHNLGDAIRPEVLVMHFTAGSSAASSVAHFMSPAAQASAHLVIARDGGVTQLVPFKRKAWHAGVSSWGGRDGVNSFSIGIELDNAGKLQQVGSSFQAWFGRSYPAEQVVVARHRNEAETAGWHAYTQPQMVAALAVGRLLVQAYSLTEVLGHDDIAPERKVDPGPAFPMASFRAHLLGRGDDAPPMFAVNVDALNLRAGPGTGFAVLRAAMPRDTPLALVQMQSLWAQVRLADGSALEGWVRNSFIRRIN